jgi:predicted nucleotidyltransferase
MALDPTGDPSLHEAIATVLSDHPVTVGILFGSQARSDAGVGSDVDVAVGFEGVNPGDPGYNETLFGVSADLSKALATDDIDVVDLGQAPPELARTVFEEGTVLVGSEETVETLRDAVLTEGEDETRSPAERFDDVLAAMDDHLA